MSRETKIKPVGTMLALTLALIGCGPSNSSTVDGAIDAGATDAGDAGTNAGGLDAGPVDAGVVDAGPCGNGVVDTGEQCDPGTNPPANDGCNPPGTPNGCQFIAAPMSEDVCPGQAVTVPSGTTILPASQGMSTYGFNDDYLGSCAMGLGGLDRVFQLVPAQSGQLTVSVGYEVDGVTPACPSNNKTSPFCWSSVLYARTTCADATHDLACSTGVDNSGNLVPAVVRRHREHSLLGDRGRLLRSELQLRAIQFHREPEVGRRAPRVTAPERTTAND